MGLVLALAALALRHALSGYRYHELVHAFRAIPPGRLALAGLAAAAVYGVMTGYDALAVRYAGRTLPYGRTAFISFVSYALSGTIGVSLLTGGTIRFSLYTAAGLDGAQVGEIVLFGAATLWLGLLALAGAVFLFAPPPIPSIVHLPIATARPLGFLFAALVTAYLVWAIRGRPIAIGGWRLRPPGARLALGQLALSLVDWCLSIGVLGLLLGPATVPPARLAASYLLAQAAGLASHIPGGLGVFDSVLVLSLKGSIAAPAVIGALLAYRIVYYVAPAMTAAALLAGIQVAGRRQHLVRLAQLVRRWGGEVAPQLFAAATFAAGALLLLSGATPGGIAALGRLERLFPLGLVEASHFVGSVVGVGLLLLALGLQRRLDAAWGLTCTLLGVGALTSSLRAAGWEQALLLALLLAALAPSRRHFYRRSSLVDERFTPGWIVAIGAVLVGSLWLGFFAYQHVEYRNELWWQFAFEAGAPRFLRASVGAILVVLVFAVGKLLRPARATVRLPATEDLQRARAIVHASPAPQANLALLGDKALFFSENGTAFLMYGVRGRTWVVLGDPVGDREEWRELLWQFREMVDRQGGRPIFYRVSQDSLPLFLELGLVCLKLGEEASVPLTEFTLEGPERRGLRYIHHRLERQQCRFELVPPGDAGPLAGELRAVSDQWLARKRTREKGFSLGRFDEAYVTRFPVGLVRREGRILAFATVWPSGGDAELTVDLMRSTDDAPRGVMEYLFVELMLWGRDRGYRSFSLGVVPLSGLTPRRLAPRWHRLANLVFQYGESVYNFRGLREFKGRFNPVWTPRYLAAPGGLALPFALTDLAALIAGGVMGALTK